MTNLNEQTMKNIFKYILGSVLATIAISACEDSSKYPIPDIAKGAIPLFTQNEDDSGIININDPASTKLSFSLVVDGLAKVNSVDVILIFNNLVTSKSDTVMYSTVSSFPADFLLSIDDLIGAFDPTVVTLDTLDIGDSFVVGGNVRLEDGRYLDGGYSPSIFSKQPVTITYNAACPSNITEGTYTATQDDGAGWFGGSSTKQVTIEKVKGTVNQYKISDVSAGGYTLCCASVGYKDDQPAIISDICNTILVTGTAGAQIDTGQGLASGSWDASTQTLVVHYADTFNHSDDDGYDLVSVFVKN